MAGGKHSHWSEYDETLEQATWNEIQASVESGGIPSAASDAGALLANYARSCGYGEADSHVNDLGIEAPDDESEERAARRESFDAYMDGPYWDHIDRSQRILAEAGEGRPDAAAVSKGASDVAQAMRDAFEAGREERLAMESSPAPAR